MSTLYLDRRHLHISVENRRLRIDSAGRRPEFVPLKMIERLVITGSTEFSSSTLASLAEAGAAVICISPRDVRRLAIVTGSYHRDASVRLAQYACALRPELRIAFARRTVRARLESQRARLSSAQPASSRAGLARRRALEQIENALKRLDAAKSTEELMGLEGGPQPAWFRFLSANLPDHLGFSGRNRRPPRDPVNAVLSLSYTLLHFDAVRAATARGLDPFVGFLHAAEYGRESLACDMIEAHRARVDILVLGLFCEKRLRADHFSNVCDACLLGKAGRAGFYAEWEEFAQPLRRLLRRQVHALAREIAGHA